MHFHAFGSASPQTKTMKVMTVLIESGILYMIFFVSYTTTLSPA